MTPPPAVPRVLATVSPDIQRRVRAILPECELRFVATGTQLVRALDEARCDMVIVEMHFDESAAMAALRLVLLREESFPIVCVRSVPPARPAPPALGALRMALGAANFIDLLQYPDDEAANARLRAVLEGLLPD